MSILAKWPKIFAIFSVIFSKNNVPFILVEFESDRMSLREGTETNWRSRVKLQFF